MSGAPAVWLRIEGLAGFIVGIAIYLANGGQVLFLIPLLLAVDLSMIGYLIGPRPGSVTYNLAHNWAVGLLVLGAGWASAAVPALLVGSVLIAHVGIDRLAGYGLKYPSSFGDTHLGRIGR